MPTILLLSGAHRYADPWHDFPETSACLARLARGCGWEVEVTEDIDERLAAGLTGIDLLIVNAGDPWRTDGEPVAPSPDLLGRARAGLLDGLDAGLAILGLHTAAASLRDYPEFRRRLGGEWVRGVSWHPPYGPVHVRPLHDEIVEGCGDFTVHDERYTDLVIDEGVEPLAGTDEGPHILAWANRVGPTRVVYDALGHDTASYDSAGHRAFLRRALSWLQPPVPSEHGRTGS